MAEEKRRYTSGHRRPDLNLRSKKQFSESRFAWADTSGGKFIILVGNQSQELGNDVVLFMPRPGRVPDLSIQLSSLTEQELDAMEEILKSAIEWARPICKLRDQEAQDAWNKGDDSFARIYRPVPQLVFRKRPEPEHYQGVHIGSEGVPEGSRGRGDSDGGVRGAGAELAEPQENFSEAEDDGKTTDESS